MFASIVVVGGAVLLGSTTRSGESSQTVEASVPGQLTTVPTPATTAASTGTSAGRGPRGSGQPVTFAFAGDVQFPDVQDTDPGVTSTGLPVLADQLKADPADVLAPITPVLSGADIAMVNLETAITERGEPVRGQELPLPFPGVVVHCA